MSEGLHPVAGRGSTDRALPRASETIADVTPVTDLGKFVTGISILVGLILVAMPISVVGQTYSEEMRRMHVRMAGPVAAAGVGGSLVRTRVSEATPSPATRTRTGCEICRRPWTGSSAPARACGSG